jgi:hypothetical protein
MPSLQEVFDDLQGDADFGTRQPLPATTSCASRGAARAHTPRRRQPRGRPGRESIAQARVTHLTTCYGRRTALEGEVKSSLQRWTLALAGLASFIVAIDTFSA